MNPQEAAAPPIFIVCCSRSGSTLLRYVLDSHPEVGCPPEMYLGELCRTLTWARALAHETRQNDPLVRGHCRDVVDAMMRDYLARVGKRRWCDKSTNTVDQLKLLHPIFPDAHYVCLYRNCMDMVHSGMEVSRFGYGSYGFRNYVVKRPDNIVAALMDYWCDKTSRALDFEERAGGACLRVRYEDLVFDSAREVPAMLQFLGLGPDPQLVERVFSVSHQGGPGDSNIVFTRRIEQHNVGKGQTIPLRHIPDEQRRRANALLERLGYPPIGDDWDDAPSPYVRQGAGVHIPAVASDAGEPPDLALARLCGMIGNVRERGAIKFVFDDCADDVWRIVLDEHVAPAVVRGDADADCEVRLPLPLLHAIANGQANPMKLLRAGDLRISGDGNLARRMFLS